MIENLTVNKRISHNKIVLSQMSYFGLYQNSKAFLTFMFVSSKRGFWTKNVVCDQTKWIVISSNHANFVKPIFLNNKLI